MSTPEPRRPHPAVIPINELEPTEHSHEFVGAEHGVVPFSVILVHSRPGVGPKLHRHPYPEVFIVESGQATSSSATSRSSSREATSSWDRRTCRTAS